MTTEPTWRLAWSLVKLRDEVNAAHPDRPTGSDGTIGDRAHRAEGSASDHNPWVIDASGVGVVRAFDITAAAFSDQLAEHLRRLGASGDRRLADHGYIIWNRRETSAGHGWVWVPYGGADPHTSHIHVSVSRDAVGYDDSSSWGVDTTKGQTAMTDEQWHFLQAMNVKLDQLAAGIASADHVLGDGSDVLIDRIADRVIERLDARAETPPA